MNTHSNQQRRRGSSVLEGALVMPVLLYLALGCVEFGDYFYIKHTLQGAAREGARAAATGTTNSDITTAVCSCMNAGGFGATPVKYTIYIRNAADTADMDISSAACTSGTAILVKVQCTWSVVGVNGMGFIKPTKTVTGTTTMRREG